MNEQRSYSDGSASRQALYANIPQELQALNQWVCWRYEHRGTEKPTKVPVNASSGHRASPTEPNSWSGFSAAIAGIELHNCDGIGFVFNDNDPYCFIDLDDTHGDTEALARQRKIYEAFNSYTELSPSGTGVHIIIQADLPNGRRRGGVELYPNARFGTFTGNVVNPAPIAERQELAEILFDELGGAKAGTAGLQGDRQATLDDATIDALLSRDPALTALRSGDLSAYGGDHSSADQALCNALAARSGNRAQVERIWLASPLGQREKTQSRADYRQRTIERAFDRPEADPLNVGNFTVNGKAFFSDAPTPGDNPTLIDAADLASRPTSPRLNIWADNVPVGQTTMFTSPGGGGKSLLLQQLCTAVATGVPMLGIQPMVCKALYVTCEDDADELHRRQHDICKALAVNPEDLRERFWLFPLTGQINNALAVFDQSGRMVPTPRYYELKATIEAKRVEVVGLDNVVHLFSGNENSRNEAAAFLGLLNMLASETGAAIILIAHTNKAGEGSGSTAWVNQVRTALKLEIPADQNGFIPDFNARRLTRVKSNYARAGASMDFRWYRGAFVRAEDLPVEEAEAAIGNERDGNDERVFLACLAERTRQRRAVSELVSKSFAPTVFAKMLESKGVPKARLEAAMDRLFQAGAIERGFLWRDTAEGKDRHGLRETPANGPANHPLTGSANVREPDRQSPPTDPPTLL